MNNPPFVSGCYYHIYNRGVEKRKIFLDKFDYRRFLETLNYYRLTPQPMKLSDFRRGKIKLKKIEFQDELVKILCFCLMPNHFHLLVQQVQDGGISEFMRKLSDSYTKYFNTKHERVGSLFQGPLKAKLIETEEYLLQLSKYIHQNPSKLEFPHGVWEAKDYPYSSYRSYLLGETHNFCDTDLILSYFSKKTPGFSYESFIEGQVTSDPGLISSLIDFEF